MLGKDTRRQLISGHFEAEKRNACACALGLFDAVLTVAYPPSRRVKSNVGGKRSFAHTRTTSQDHKVAVVQPTAFRIDTIEPRRHSRQMSAGIQRLLDILDCFGRRHQEALHRAGFALTFGDFVQRAFGGFDLALGVNTLAGVERIINQGSSNCHQFAQQRQIINLLGKVTRADEARTVSGQFHQIARPAKLTHRFVGFEKRFQRDRRDEHIAVDQAENLLIHPAV